jgi:D-sedoheptulose 7-phosphate isomerase
MTSPDGTIAPGAAALYPFLAGHRDDAGRDRERILDEVRRSTVAKVDEIGVVRRAVRDRDGRRLAQCAHAMADRFSSGGRLLTFGNGGSCTDAQDLAGLFLRPGAQLPALPAVALTNDVAVLTALTNDVGFGIVFARQVAALAQPADIAVGLSTSGNSMNLLVAFDEAHRRGLLTVGLSGYDGGKMAELSTIDYLFVVPSPSVHRIQEAQATVYHALWELTVHALALRRM